MIDFDDMLQTIESTRGSLIIYLQISKQASRWVDGQQTDRQAETKTGRSALTSLNSL
jgi:hypothetical protein